jgi:hypothetical protein
MVTFDFALETAMQLPPVERVDLIEILKKRQSQEWRKDTAVYYQDFKKQIVSENIIPLSANEAINELHNYLDSSD